MDLGIFIKGSQSTSSVDLIVKDRGQQSDTKMSPSEWLIQNPKMLVQYVNWGLSF
jgi:hypothetical protein